MRMNRAIWRLNENRSVRQFVKLHVNGAADAAFANKARSLTNTAEIICARETGGLRYTHARRCCKRKMCSANLEKFERCN